MKNLILFQIAQASDDITKDEDTDESNIEKKTLQAQKERSMAMIKRMKLEEEALELQLATVRNITF